MAAKEALRPAYEAYMTAYFDAFVLELTAAVVAAQADLDAAEAAEVIAQDAYDLARAPLTALEDAQTELVAANAAIDLLIVVYEAVDDFNELNFLDAIQAMIVTADGDVDAAETAYAIGMVNYEQWTADMVILEANLVAAQEMVAYWKALLDAALAG